MLPQAESASKRATAYVLLLLGNTGRGRATENSPRTPAPCVLLVIARLIGIRFAGGRKWRLRRGLCRFGAPTRGCGATAATTDHPHSQPYQQRQHDPLERSADQLEGKAQQSANPKA